MKKTKRKAVINLIIFFLLLAGGIYMAIAGVGQNDPVKLRMFRWDWICRAVCP